MALPDIYAKTTLVISDSDRDHFYNVFYYKPMADPGLSDDHLADAVLFNDAAYLKLATNVPAVMGGDVYVRGCNTVLYVSGQSFSVSNNPDDQGTASGDMEPDFVAVCIQKRTTVAGKSGRGRWFLGPVLEANTLEDYIQILNLPAYQTIADDWGAAINILGDTWNPQLYSKKNDSLTEIVATRANSKLATIVGRKSRNIL